MQIRSFLPVPNSLRSSEQNVNYQLNNSSFMGKSDLENKPDEEVILALRNGNHLALEIIYDRYGALIYRVIYKILKNRQEAEDLTQEIFIILQEKCNYNAKKGSFYNYLMLLSRSRTIDRLRTKNSQGKLWQNMGKLTDLAGCCESNNPLECISADERARQVKQALQHLSAQQRQVLELSYYEGLSQTEIAKHLQIPLGTVKTHSRRGLLRLKQYLSTLLK